MIKLKLSILDEIKDRFRNRPGVTFNNIREETFYSDCELSVIIKVQGRSVILWRNDGSIVGGKLAKDVSLIDVYIRLSTISSAGDLLLSSVMPMLTDVRTYRMNEKLIYVITSID